MKNNRIVVKDLGVLSYEDSWELQKTIFENIISQKIKDSISSRKPVVSDKLNKNEINSFLGFSRNLENLKQNNSKGIKFFDDW